MKSHPKSASLQLNLALLDRAPAELPHDEQQELSLALVELLVDAATPARASGDQQEVRMNSKLTNERLHRRAIVYLRQSSPEQVFHNQESQRRQYGLADQARELGFQEVQGIDGDRGRTGSGLVERPGFQRWV